MTRHFGPLAATAAVILIASGCGDSDETGAGTTEYGSVDTEQTEDGVRAVDHALGSSDVPADPQRIVLLSSGAIDQVRALGIEPVGTVVWGGINEIPDYVAEELSSEVVEVGTDTEPDFELIASLDPDLILGHEYIEEFRTQLESIAPVVAYEREDPSGARGWQDQLLQIGDFLDRSDEAEDVIADYQSDIATLDEILPDAGLEVAALRIRAEEVRHYTADGTISSQVLQDSENIELSGPEISAVEDDDIWAVISEENLTDITQEWLYLVPDSAEALEDLTGSAVWERVPAVENGNVCVAQNPVAWFLEGPYAAQQVIEDVGSCLGDSDAESDG